MTTASSEQSDRNGAGRVLVLATMVNRLETLQKGLEGIGWQVDSTGQPQEALDLLKARPFAAVVCDEYLRGASPAGFLAWTRRLAPEAAFYLVCINCADMSFLGSHEPDGVIEFPPTPESLPRPHPEARRSRSSESSHEVPLEGNTSLVPLVDLIEMLGVIGRSAVISLDGGDRGRVVMNGGALVHAEAKTETGSSVSGIAALARLMVMSDLDYRVTGYAPPARRTIHLSTTNALAEAARMHDERSRNQELFAQIERACPQLESIAIGYALSQQPAQGSGTASTEVFEAAQNLLERSATVLGKTQRLAAETHDHAYAVLVFGDDNLIAATAEPGHAAELLSAMVAAVASREA